MNQPTPGRLPSRALPSLAVALGAALSLVLPTQAQNYVFNPGFEEGSAEDATTWNQIEVSGGTMGATAMVDRVMSDAQTGDYSMLLDVVGATDWGPNAEVQQQTAVGSVVTGQTYRFGFSSKGFAGPGTVASYDLLWFDGDGSDGGGVKGSAFGTLNFAMGGSYALNSHTGLVPAAGSDSVLIQIRVLTGAFDGAIGNASIDDVYFEPETPIANFLANGGFEDGTGADADNWNELGAGATSTVGRSTNEPASGTAHAYMEVDNTVTQAGAAVYVDQTLGARLIDPSLLYDLSFQAKSDSTDFTGMNLFVQVQWLDQDGSHGGGVVSETLESLISYGPGLGTSYQAFSLTGLNPTAGADSVTVRFQLSAGADPGLDNGLLVDDVVLASAGAAPVEDFTAEIQQGTVVSWAPMNADSTYQVQESPDNINWTNLGPAFSGTDTDKAFDADGPAAHYRVEETGTVVTESALNGGFEAEGVPDPLCALNWECVQPAPAGNFGDYLPTRITSDFRSGTASMQLKVVNDLGNPTKSLILQNVFAQGGSIVPGADYTFSFWAKQISSGVSYVQGYAVKWLAPGGAVLAETGFQPFTGGSGTWNEVSIATTAPAGAESALIEIAAETGAVPGPTAEGEVLIDDVSLVTSGGGSTTILPATAGPGVGILWDTTADVDYQVKSSTTLSGFTNLGGVITGDGNQASAADTIDGPANFYIVEEVE